MITTTHPRFLGAAAALIGATLVGCSSAPGSLAAASGPSIAASANANALTQAFTSKVGGYSLMLPASMDPVPGKAAMPGDIHTWTSEDPWVDQFLGEGVGPMDVASAPVPAARADQWIKDQLAAQLLTGSAFPAVCKTTLQTETITVDGHAGVLDTHCGPALLTAIVPAGDRIYVIELHGDPPDRAFFDSVLASVHLDPGAALAGPRGTPAASAAPSPASSH